MKGRSAALAGAVAFALASAGCHGSGLDKAGAGPKRASAPLTLTLLTGDATFAPEYAAAVERLSGGTMRIQVTVGGNQPSYEAGTVRAVRSGRYALGATGARVWDAFRVTSFQALVAPFLIQSLALERRVLAGPLAARMLAGIRRAGVVGLAVLPGPLRRPLGLTRAFVGPADYHGATIAIRYGGVARETFAALGAKSRGYVIGYLPPVDGAELDLNTIAENGYDTKARALTANVVLWPRPQTFFANRAAYDRLTPDQRRILVRAGRAALQPELARVVKDEEAGLAGVCERSSASLVTASATDVAALQRAVRPVYRALDRDPATRRFVAAIERLRGGGALAGTDTVRCGKTRGGQSLASRLNGSWQVNTSAQDLLAVGANPVEAERQHGSATLELRNGRWVGRERRSGFVWRGTYLVRGNVLRVVVDSCPREVPCARGPIAAYAWSVYDDRLSLALLSGTPWYFGLIARPLTRAG